RRAPRRYPTTRARRCAFVAPSAAWATTPAGAPDFAAAVGPIVRDKQSLAAVLTCRATADTGLSRWDRMMTAQWCLPAAIHRPDKNSTRHQSRYDCIGDSASCWPLFEIGTEPRTVVSG